MQSHGDEVTVVDQDEMTPLVKENRRIIRASDTLCGRTMIKAMAMLTLGIAAIGLVSGLGAYHSANPIRPPLSHEETVRNYVRSVRENIFDKISGENIADNLREITSEPHVAGTEANGRVAEKIAAMWRRNGLENVHFINYEVLLSYPDYDHPNHVAVLEKNGDRELFKSSGVSPVIIPAEQGAPGAGVQWLAYAGNGTVTGQIVYCNSGRKEDFDWLDQLGIAVRGKIAMIRYGKGFRGDKVHEAQQRGAIAVILFSEPDDVARLGLYPGEVYPATEWMPSHGVQRGSIMHGDGDALSPLYPSKKNLYRSRTIEQAKSEGILPSIPALPLSYADAYQLLRRMTGQPVPADWQGAMNFTYRLGPGMQNEDLVRVTVHSSLQVRNIRNVVGYIRGTEEPDSYVILGNHYDAWVYGSLDPNSGTATLAEVARVLAQAANESSWKPGRTLMFINWDAEEFGLIGSTEFVEEFANTLTQRAVVYLNVDTISSNQSLTVATVPTMFQAVLEAAKAIPNPMESEIKAGRTTIYDTWQKTFPGKLEWRRNAPKMGIPGGGSDHAPFLNFIGVPVINFEYRNATKRDTYPLYHSLYETRFVNSHIIDTNNLAVHKAVGQYWAELARLFAGSPVLPMNVTDLALSIARIYLRQLKEAMPIGDYLTEAKTQLGYLINTAQNFVEQARDFHQTVAQTKQDLERNPFDLRRSSSINARLMAVDRCFVNPRGIPGAPHSRHVLFSISPHDSYASSVLAAVHDQIEAYKSASSEMEKQLAGGRLANQISIVHYSLQCAMQQIVDVI